MGNEFTLGSEIQIRLPDGTAVKLVDQLGLSQTLSDAALERAKEYSDLLNTATLQEVSEVQQSIVDLNNYIDGAFKDGVISQAESIAIKQRLANLEAEKSDLDSRYNGIYNNVDLTDTDKKSDLFSKKGAYNTAHSNLITVINNAIADGIGTPEEATQIDLKESEYRTALANLTDSIELAVDAIAKKKAQSAENTAKAYADGLKQAVDADIQDVNQRVTDLNTYIDGAFEDGIVSEAEALGIRQRINGLNAEKADIDTRYTNLYTHPDLTDTTVETALQTAKTNYDTAHTNLVNAIETAIADTSISQAEKDNLQLKETAYRDALSGWATASEDAINAIISKRANTAEENSKQYANTEYGGVKTRVNIWTDEETGLLNGAQILAASIGTNHIAANAIRATHIPVGEIAAKQLNLKSHLLF